MARKKEEPWSQAKYRMAKFFTDQHGRRWFANVERTTQRPIGQLQPDNFTAPWVPPDAGPQGQPYYRFAGEGELDQDRVTLDYEQVFRDYVQANRDYHNKCVQEAASKNWPLPIPGKPVYRQLRLICGEAPKSPVVPRAAMRGDPWLLGVPGAPVNPTLAAILQPENEWDRWYKEAGYETGIPEHDPTGGKPLAAADEALMNDLVAAGEAMWPSEHVPSESSSEVAELKEQVAQLMATLAAVNKDRAVTEPQAIEQPEAPAAKRTRLPEDTARVREYRKFITQERKAGKTIEEATAAWTAKQHASELVPV